MRSQVFKILFISLGMISGRAAGLESALTHNMVYELRFPYLEDKCMDVAEAGIGDGTNIRLWSCNNTASQRFKAMALDSVHFQLVSINSGRCVDVAGGGMEDSTNVHLWSCNGSDAQAFRVERLPDERFDFVNKKSGRCLDVNRSSSSNGANIQVWACNQSNAQRVRLVPSYADTIMEAFNATYLVEKDGKTYYKTSLHNPKFDYFWRQALSIMSLQDAYLRNSSVAYRNKISALLNTFIKEGGPDWNWNGFNDDLAWAGLAFIRGYQITGNQEFYRMAKNGFDLVYRRGWSGELGGGIWWNSEGIAKEALSNNPNAILACYLYQASGNAWYRDRALDIYNWVRNHLFDASTGALYQGIKQNGELIDYVYNYNIGTFVEAANCLRKSTGQSAPYYDDALRAIEYVRIHQTSPEGIILPIGFGEFARGLSEFMRDYNLQKRYLGWLEKNSRAVWNSRRPDLGVTGNVWTQPSPMNVDLEAFNAKDGVTMLQIAPL